MESLSIIIVSFNTKAITLRCLRHLKRNLNKYPLDYEIIVVDNDSLDGSINMLVEEKKSWQNLQLILSKRNLGYGKANNLGVKNSHGRYILYLNSDVIIEDVDLRDLLNIFKTDSKIGALTVKVTLPSGEIDPASHRGFPSLWRSFCYFIGLEELFSRTFLLNRIFGGYHLTDEDLTTVHEIDSGTGAFFLTKKEIIDQIGGFDKDYFAYGEDLEMCYRIKELGYKIIYYPLWQVLHLKYSSGLRKNDKKVREMTKFHFYNSMKIFYRKHYAKKYPWIINQLVYLAIDLKRKLFK